MKGVHLKMTLRDSTTVPVCQNDTLINERIKNDTTKNTKRRNTND